MNSIQNDTESVEEEEDKKELLFKELIQCFKKIDWKNDLTPLWNEKWLLLKKLYEVNNWSEFINIHSGADLTKIISPIFDVLLKKILKNIEEFIETKENKKDYTYKQLLGVEAKLNISQMHNINKTSWTGNGYEKVPYHLLVKITFTTTGEINTLCMILVNLDKCLSKWSEKKTKSNFSSLQFYKEDQQHINIIVGTCQPKVKRLHFKGEEL